MSCAKDESHKLLLTAVKPNVNMSSMCSAETCFIVSWALFNYTKCKTSFHSLTRFISLLSFLTNPKFKTRCMLSFAERQILYITPPFYTCSFLSTWTTVSVHYLPRHVVLEYTWRIALFIWNIHNYVALKKKLIYIFCK